MCVLFFVYCSTQNGVSGNRTSDPHFITMWHKSAVFDIIVRIESGTLWLNIAFRMCVRGMQFYRYTIRRKSAMHLFFIDIELFVLPDL